MSSSQSIFVLLFLDDADCGNLHLGGFFEWIAEITVLRLSIVAERASLMRASAFANISGWGCRWLYSRWHGESFG